MSSYISQRLILLILYFQRDPCVIVYSTTEVRGTRVSKPVTNASIMMALNGGRFHTTVMQE